jgi:hypothetical protein
MGRTGPVIRAGLVARAGHGGSTVTAAAVVAAVLLAGCGTRPAGPPARGRPTPAAAISTGPGAVGSCGRLACRGPGAGRVLAWHRVPDARTL